MNGKGALKFLGELKSNNNREWFEKNKTWFREEQKYFTEMVGAILEKASHLDPDLGLLEPKKCVFRIYRDVRFSKDKSPYKTNFGAWINKGGKQSTSAGYYFQISPGASFIGGGVYHPEAVVLSKVRQEIDYNGQQIHSILSSKGFTRYFSGLWDGDTLKRAPKGYEPDHPDIDLIKLKSFVGMHQIPDSIIKKNGLEDYVSEVFEATAPLVNYLNAAILDDY
jgi:uncharacterized protein (TIGR02453 family)